jgi:hypothetical protein
MTAATRTTLLAALVGAAMLGVMAGVMWGWGG